MATVTKKEIAARLSNKTGMTQHETSDLVEALLQTLADALGAGDAVTFRTFGTFEVRVARGKIGRNPNQPAKAVPIPDRCVVRFKPGHELKQRVAALPLPDSET